MFRRILRSKPLPGHQRALLQRTARRRASTTDTTPSSSKAKSFTPKATPNGTSKNHPPRPTYEQLRVLFLHSAAPMVGFGLMDNLVMM